MKSKTLIILLLSILGIALFLSTIYDKKVNADKIAMYKCKNNPVVPFPTEYLKPDAKQGFNSKKHQISSGFKLDWENTGLTGLPDDVFRDYSCIKYLDISDNNFTQIPTAIRDLKGIKELSLNNNKITSAKNDNIDFQEFKDLRSINLSNNLIDTLDFIPTTSRFFRLIINDNQIKHVNLINSSKSFVSTLDLTANQLKVFPPDFYRLHNLVELDISHNEISGKVILRGLEKLTSLDISSQITDSIRITSIIVDGESCSNLIYLSALNNHISSFTFNYTPTTTTNPLKQLQIVNFNSNNFTNFPDLIYDCPSINTLELSNNQFSFIKFKHSMLALHRLYLSNNQIKEINELKEIPNIQKLDLSHNQLIRFPLFDDNPNLFDLDLSHNNIETLIHFTRNDSTTESFQKVDLSHNQIRVFEKSGKNYPSLKELNLSNNQITTFHCNDYPKLEKLDLSNNNLKEIIYDGNYASFLKIKELNLSNNPNLTDIPTTMFNSSNHLKIINIKNTNLNADLVIFMVEYCKRNKIELIK